MKVVKCGHGSLVSEVHWVIQKETWSKPNLCPQQTEKRAFFFLQISSLRRVWISARGWYPHSCFLMLTCSSRTRAYFYGWIKSANRIHPKNMQIMKTILCLHCFEHSLTIRGWIHFYKLRSSWFQLICVTTIINTLSEQNVRLKMFWLVQCFVVVGWNFYFFYCFHKTRTLVS